MAYTFPEIDIWSKMSQPLARIGEANKKRSGDSSADLDLDMKIYLARLDCEYEYDQDVNSANLYPMMNYLYSLCFPYVLTAQAATIGGGTITPITPPTGLPDPYDFTVSVSSFIVNGASVKTFPTSWIGLNILFVRDHITQSVIDDGVDTAYSWNKSSATLTLINGAAVTGESFQIFPIT